MPAFADFSWEALPCLRSGDKVGGDGVRGGEGGETVVGVLNEKKNF